jgi:trans-2,3-dihydro-3-hydroxyanthranilate isomerase
MKDETYYILDVFAEKKYTGNQLAVVWTEKILPDNEMQNIAREFNFSETTFIQSSKIRNGGYDVRIFTPQKEVPFAGHPVLGTAYVIQKEIIKKPVKNIILNLKAGQIPVEIEYKSSSNNPPLKKGLGSRCCEASQREAGGFCEINKLTMKQMQPTFGRTFNKNRIASVLNIRTSEIDTKLPVEEVSTGLPFIIVPIKTLSAVKKAGITQEKYLELIQHTDAKAIIIFCPETYNKENQLNVRVFADYYGIPEDPATGSANGCLAGYLVRHNYFSSDHINIRVEQGCEIQRPSLLFLEAKSNGEGIDVYVGGKVVEVARGVLV